MVDLHSQTTSSPNSESPSQPNPHDNGHDTDDLAHLAKMSGTGGAFGAAEYVAINVAAIVSLLLGFASALSLMIGLLLFIPILGIFVGFLALGQIRRSNGTQGGRGFALAGIALSVILGGLVVGLQSINLVHTREESRKCADIITRFGEEMNAGHFDAIYENLMSDAFRGRYKLPAFRAGLQQLQNIPGYGPVESIHWNDERMEFQNNSEIAVAMTLVKFRNFTEPTHETMRLTNHDGSWKLDSAFSRLFPDQKPPKRFDRNAEQ